MHVPQLPSLLALAVLAVASPVALVEERTFPSFNQCAPAVVFAVRPSDTMQETLTYNPRYNILPTAMNDTANAVVRQAGGNSYVSFLQYPAIDPRSGMYRASVNMGIANLQAALQNYTSACPIGQVFVLGYSQGAQVTSSAIAGSSPPLAEWIQKRITAGVLYADPQSTDFYEPVDQGSGAADGLNGTTPNGAPIYAYLNANYTNRIRNFCEAGDKTCDSGTGPNAQAIHLNATQYFEANATKFLLERTL